MFCCGRVEIREEEHRIMEVIRTPCSSRLDFCCVESRRMRRIIVASYKRADGKLLFLVKVN